MVTKRIGLLGPPNTGKSFARTFLPGEECLVLMPSVKQPFLYDKKGKSCTELEIYSEVVQDPIELAKRLKWTEKNQEKPSIYTMASLTKIVEVKGESALENIRYRGNYVYVGDFLKLPFVLKYVSLYMPHIKVIVLADFTHYLSNYVKSDAFLGRTKGMGGAQFDKYIRLAVETLDTFFGDTMNNLRDDLIVITEFHTEDREDKKRVKDTIFVPAGTMLGDWFKPESYYDVLLGSMVLPASEEPDKSKRFKFVTSPISEEYRFCRDMGMFEDDIIPNNLQIVVETLRKKQEDINYVHKLDKD